MAPGLCPSALSRRTSLIFRMDNRSAAIVPSPWFVFARLQGRLVDGLMTQLSSVLHPPQLRDVPHVPEWQCHIPEMALPLAPERPFHFDRNDPSTWAGIRRQRHLRLGEGNLDGTGLAPGTGLESEPSSASEGSAPAVGESSTEDAGLSEDASSLATKEERQPSFPPGAALPGGRGRKAPVRLGLTIRFEHRPDHDDLGRLVESTVWVNEAHPAYRRAASTRSEDYHLALTVAMALAPLAVETAHLHDFVTAFLARWGEAGKGGEAGRTG